MGATVIAATLVDLVRGILVLAFLSPLALGALAIRTRRAHVRAANARRRAYRLAVDTRRAQHDPRTAADLPRSA